MVDGDVYFAGRFATGNTNNCLPGTVGFVEKSRDKQFQ
jgi:hypothetical protein